MTTTNSSSRWPAVLALLAATAAWGGLFHAGKHALSALDPFWFTALRYTGATALLLAVSAAKGGIRWDLTRGHGWTLFSYGMLGYGMFGILVFVGLAQSVPSHGAVVMATMPLTTLFIRWILDKQTPQWWAWVGALVALIGVGFVSGAWAGSAQLGGATWRGDAIAWVGSLGWIVYTRGQLKLPALNVIEYTTCTALAALPGVFAVALFATLSGWVHWPDMSGVVRVTPSLTYIVVIGTVLAALLFNFGVRRLGATNGIIFINFVPISALIISALTGHTPTQSELFGTALVVAALLWLAYQMYAAATRPKAALSADTARAAC